MNRLTPNQHGMAAAAAYVGCLAAGLAVIYAVIDTGNQSRELAAKCIARGNSAELCSVRFYGR
jgi:hypothetical protein